MKGVAWKLRFAMMLQLAACALTAWFALNVLGGGIQGWGIAFGALAVVFVIVGRLLENGLLRRLNA